MEITEVELLRYRKRAYDMGYMDGIEAYAYEKSSDRLVGVDGLTLKDALADISDTWNYNPPKQEIKHDS